MVLSGKSFFVQRVEHFTDLSVGVAHASVIAVSKSFCKICRNRILFGNAGIVVQFAIDCGQRTLDFLQASRSIVGTGIVVWIVKVPVLSSEQRMVDEALANPTARKNGSFFALSELNRFTASAGRCSVR